MNKKLLKRIQRHLSKPEVPVEMMIFVGEETENGAPVRFKKDFCNTARCIGEDALLLENQLEVKRLDGYSDILVKGHPNSSIYSAAKKLLRLTTNQASRLFNYDMWPEAFRVDYQASRNRATAARIDHFIATDGRE